MPVDGEQSNTTLALCGGEMPRMTIASLTPRLDSSYLRRIHGLWIGGVIGLPPISWCGCVLGLAAHVRQ